MKIIISIIIITISVVFLLDIVSDNREHKNLSHDQSVESDTLNDQRHNTFVDADGSLDRNDTPIVKDQPVGTNISSSQQNKISENSDKPSAQYNSYSRDTDATYGRDNSSYEAYNSSYNQDYSTYGNTDSSYNQDYSTYGNAGSSYNQDYSTYGSASSSYEQDNSSYRNNDSSYDQNTSTRSSAGALFSQPDSSTKTKNKQDAQASEEASASEDTENAEGTETVENTESQQASVDSVTNYQRVYDNGIVWYGNIGTLLVQYQSSSAETTGLGFRVHFDSSAMNISKVTYYPVDAIASPSAQSSRADTDNLDSDTATNYFLLFAWASLYGQWPQANQVTLATIEFEKVEGGSTNYNINYSPISVAAGFQFIQ